MNRKERRKLFGKYAAAVKEPTHTLTKSRLSQMIKEAMTEYEGKILPRAYALALSTAFINLRDSLGFGQKRMSDFAQKCINTFDSVAGGYVTLDEIANQVYEETGVMVQIDGDSLCVKTKDVLVND